MEQSSSSIRPLSFSVLSFQNLWTKSSSQPRIVNIYFHPSSGCLSPPPLIGGSVMSKIPSTLSRGITAWWTFWKAPFFHFRQPAPGDKDWHASVHICPCRRHNLFHLSTSQEDWAEEVHSSLFSCKRMIPRIVCGLGYTSSLFWLNSFCTIDVGLSE